MHATLRTCWTKTVAALSLFLIALSAVVATPAVAQSRSQPPRPNVQADSDRPVPNETRPLPEIVARVQATPPYNGMDYIGVESFQVRQRIYVLRFIDGRQVVVVHVDARSGRIIGRGQ